MRTQRTFSIATAVSATITAGFATAVFATIAITAVAVASPLGKPLGAQQQSAASDAEALALLESTAAAYRSDRTLRADFTQTLVSTRSNDAMTSTGTFYQRGETEFGFHFSSPSEDRIISDGTSLWLYIPSTVKGQVIKVPRALGGGFDIATAVLNDAARRYTVTAGRDSVVDGRTVSEIQLAPRTPDVPFIRATLWIDAGSKVIRRAEFTEPLSMVRTLVFMNIRTGGQLPADAFRFTVPEGVRVVDQSGGRP